MKINRCNLTGSYNSYIFDRDYKTHDGLNRYREDCLVAAKDLCYGPEVIEKINNAETEFQLEHIMRSAANR